MKRIVQVQEAGRLSPRPGSSDGAGCHTVGGSQREENPQLEVSSYSGTKAQGSEMTEGQRGGW